VIGLGNPILGDDGVGWVVVHEIESRIGEVDHLSLGGLSLMERLIGYEVVAIESQHVYDIQEGLTPAIASAVPAAVQRALEVLLSIQDAESGL